MDMIVLCMLVAALNLVISHSCLLSFPLALSAFFESRNSIGIAGNASSTDERCRSLQNSLDGANK